MNSNSDKRSSLPSVIKGILKTDRSDMRSRNSEEYSISNSGDNLSKRVDIGSMMDYKKRGSLQFDDFSDTSEPWNDLFTKKEVRFNLEHKAKPPSKRSLKKQKERAHRYSENFEKGIASEGDLNSEQETSKSMDDETIRIVKLKGRCVSSIGLNIQSNDKRKLRVKDQIKEFDLEREESDGNMDFYELTPQKPIILDNYTLTTIDLMNGQSFPMIFPKV